MMKSQINYYYFLVLETLKKKKLKV